MSVIFRQLSNQSEVILEVFIELYSKLFARKWFHNLRNIVSENFGIKRLLAYIYKTVVKKRRTQTNSKLRIIRDFLLASYKYSFHLAYEQRIP